MSSLTLSLSVESDPITFYHFVLAQQVLHLPFTFNPWVWVAGVVGGAGGITLAGMMATRSVLRTPPLAVLRRVNA